MVAIDIAFVSVVYCYRTLLPSLAAAYISLSQLSFDAFALGLVAWYMVCGLFGHHRPIYTGDFFRA